MNAPYSYLLVDKIIDKNIILDNFIPFWFLEYDASVKQSQFIESSV